MAPEPAPAEIFPFTRCEHDISELRALCQEWQQGKETFWSFDDVLAALSRPGTVGLFAAAAPNAPWRGLILAYLGPYTADLLYVFVRPGWRRTGDGRRLLIGLIELLRAKPQMEGLLLEVRDSNVAARQLYESLGLVTVGRRKRYYRDGEDALLLRLELKDEGV